MKKIVLLVAALMVGAFAFQSCEDMDDTDVPVNDFVWKGLNLYYFWKDQVPDLADDRFSNQGELNTYLKRFSTPEDLFESLLYREDAQRVPQDRFSVIFPDYRVLENALQGVVKSNGVEYGLIYTDDTQTTLFGYVRYILPGSDAASKDIQRGDIFYAVNGTPLTIDNYRGLLGNDTYTLNLANFNGGAITPNDESVSLTKSEYSENPVYTVQVITQGSHKIGYLMYNGFYSTYDAELNAAFAELASQGVTDLVLDLRYNSGGSIRTATYLASMITGQFNGQVFAKQQWNARLQRYYEQNDPSALTDNFANSLSNGAAINSLNLSKVYILATGASASASELVINSLKPYIDVTVIGAKTVGKNVGSVTLYDSRDFSRRDLKSNYAMQPIVLRIVNKDGFGDYSTGIAPDVAQPENYDNLGVLGSPDEPLFARAINLITSQGRMVPMPLKELKNFKDSKSISRFGTEMYLETTPDGSTGLIKDLQ
ncbi:MAG: peptidase S41 [Flavobacterium sp.]|nr:MAG: peptidase S41 [Flavobacterium sp.]